MKRFLPAAAALLLMMAVPLFAATAPPPRLVDDVIRMSKAGVGDDTILSFVEKTGGHYEVSPDEIIAMTEAGLSKPLINALVKGAGTDLGAGNRGSGSERDWREGNRSPGSEDWRQGKRAPASDDKTTDCDKGTANCDNNDCVEPPYVSYYYPYYAWDPFFDPYWYMPRFFGSFGFRGHHGGGDGGHHGGGGGGHHGGGGGGHHSGGGSGHHSGSGSGGQHSGGGGHGHH